MAEGKRYRVVISELAAIRYQVDILPYLFKNFSPQRITEVEDSLKKVVASLETFPHRGSIEHFLEEFKSKEYRYILFRESRFFELKIIYRVDEHTSTVFVADYFPTPMHPKRMTKPK